VPTATATAAFVGQRISEAFDLYQPDLVVSVHPLMQVRGRPGEGTGGGGCCVTVAGWLLVWCRSQCSCVAMLATLVLPSTPSSGHKEYQCLTA
jgi:hypothetical protein